MTTTTYSPTIPGSSINPQLSSYGLVGDPTTAAASSLGQLGFGGGQLGSQFGQLGFGGGQLGSQFGQPGSQIGQLGSQIGQLGWGSQIGQLGWGSPGATSIAALHAAYAQPFGGAMAQAVAPTQLVAQIQAAQMQAQVAQQIHAHIAQQIQAQIAQQLCAQQIQQQVQQAQQVQQVQQQLAAAQLAQTLGQQGAGMFGQHGAGMFGQQGAGMFGQAGSIGAQSPLGNVFGGIPATQSPYTGYSQVFNPVLATAAMRSALPGASTWGLTPTTVTTPWNQAANAGIAGLASQYGSGIGAGFAPFGGVSGMNSTPYLTGLTG